MKQIKRGASGRLKSLIAHVWENFEPELEIRVINEVDQVLQNQECVITSDSIILDRCQSWFNLVGLCIERTKAVPVKVWQ